MKKFSVIIVFIFSFLLIGCDRKNEDVDLTNSPKVKDTLVAYSAEDAYGKIVHHGVMADKVVVKNLKFQENLYGYAIGVAKGNQRATVTLVCDTRADEAVLTQAILNSDGFIPKGNNLEFSIMPVRGGVTDIREVDDSHDPIFSTANGETDFFAGIKKVIALPKNTVIALVIDKGDEEGNYSGIAWSPLFTVEQLVEALPENPSKCLGIKLNLDSDYLVAAEKG